MTLLPIPHKYNDVIGSSSRVDVYVDSRTKAIWERDSRGDYRKTSRDASDGFIERFYEKRPVERRESRREEPRPITGEVLGGIKGATAIAQDWAKSPKVTTSGQAARSIGRKAKGAAGVLSLGVAAADRYCNSGAPPLEVAARDLRRLDDGLNYGVQNPHKVMGRALDTAGYAMEATVQAPYAALQQTTEAAAHQGGRLKDYLTKIVEPEPSGGGSSDRRRRDDRRR